LDVGSNKGVQIRKIFEPELYPDSLVLPIFTKAFGTPTERCQPATDTGICVLGLEPNPQHQDRLKQIAAAYQNYGWRVHFYFMAASTKDGQVSFTGNGGGADIAAHLTLLQWEDVPVRAIDLASFIQSLPAGSVKLMKMDIEGEEFNVVDRMAETGALCKDVVQEALVEVHNVTSITTWANTSRWNGREPNADGLASFIQGQPCERGTMELLPVDDESYLEDVNEDFGKANPCRSDAPPQAVTAAAA
jgi:FkbM family methyltransferase